MDTDERGAFCLRDVRGFMLLFSILVTRWMLNSKKRWCRWGEKNRLVEWVETELSINISTGSGKSSYWTILAIKFIFSEVNSFILQNHPHFHHHKSRIERKLFVESWKFTFSISSSLVDCWCFIYDDEAMMRKFYAVLFIFTSFRNSQRRLSSRCCTFYYCCGLVDWLQRSSFLLAKTIFNDHTQHKAERFGYEEWGHTQQNPIRWWKLWKGGRHKIQRWQWRRGGK